MFLKCTDMWLRIKRVNQEDNWAYFDAQSRIQRVVNYKTTGKKILWLHNQNKQPEGLKPNVVISTRDKKNLGSIKSSEGKDVSSCDVLRKRNTSQGRGDWTKTQSLEERLEKFCCFIQKLWPRAASNWRR